MEQKIAKYDQIVTDQWTGYKSLNKILPNLTHIKSANTSKNFPAMYWITINFEGWPRGMQQHFFYLLECINEYIYPLNYSMSEGNVFYNLLKKTIKIKLHNCKIIIN